MQNMFPNELTLDTIEYIVNENEAIAVESSVYRIDNDSRWNDGSPTLNCINTWSDFRKDWEYAKTKYKRAVLSRNLETQRDALIEEKKLILKYIHKVDTFEENAIQNIAFFVGLVALTVGLTALVLTIPESLVAVDMGEKAYAGSKLAEATGKSFAFHSTKAKFATTAKVGATVANAATVMKLMAMGMSYNNPTARSILRSQRSTGVFSKQLLISTLYRYLAKVEKKIKLNLTETVLNTDEFAQMAVEKYSNDFLENYVKQIHKMQGKMNDFSADLAKINAERGAHVPSAKEFRDNLEKGSNKGSGNNNNRKGNNGGKGVTIDMKGGDYTKETQKLLKALGNI